MAIQFSQLEGITNGKLINLSSDQKISILAIDSRKSASTLGSLFFAIKGPQRDGHDYIKSAFDAGVRQFVVSSDYHFSPDLKDECNVLAVHDTVMALQQIAAFHRKQFDLKVIAITGSNGKTIVKEWLSQILNRNFKVVKSPKSYNSQVGVPLSVWQIDSNDEIGVFEAGISQPGEMASLENILKPDIGIFTNIGPAHAEGFLSLEQKIDEKLKLFKHCGRIIFCADHTFLAEIIEKKKSQFNNSEFVSWSAKGKNADYNFTITDGAIKLNKPDLIIKTDTKNPIALENLIHCIVVAQLLGMTSDEINESISQLTPVEMRLELKKGINGCYLVDDSYNNDLASLEIALNFAHQQVGFLEKTLILSDILQSGLEPSDLYQEVNKLVSSGKITRLIGIGESISACRSFFNIPSTFFSSTNEFLKAFPYQKFENEAIIIKGARAFRFEKIVESLQEKSHGTRLIVNLDAIVHNFNFYRDLLKPETKIMVMVKALAYGGGSFEIGSLLSYHKADYLAVAYVDEGIELRNKGVQTPIMVMNPSPDSVNLLSRFDLEPEIFSIGQLKSILANDKDSFPQIHLKIDTGMNRLGFQENDIDELLTILISNPNLKVGSIFSHLVGSEDPDLDGFTHDQYERFQKISELIIDKIGYRPLLHLLNSSGITRFPEMQLDMVRLGIGLYGISPEKGIQDQLETVSTLQTNISQIRKVKSGQTVGYGRAYTAEKNRTIATIAIGYADGFDRRFGNGVGKVLVGQQLVPVIGNVCMDMSMIDVTGIDVSEGDVVTIFGNGLPVTALSESIGTIPYEILSTIGNRVKRIFHSA